MKLLILILTFLTIGTQPSFGAAAAASSSSVESEEEFLTIQTSEISRFVPGGDRYEELMAAKKIHLESHYSYSTKGDSFDFSGIVFLGKRGGIEEFSLSGKFPIEVGSDLVELIPLAAETISFGFKDKGSIFLNADQNSYPIPMYVYDLLVKLKKHRGRQKIVYEEQEYEKAHLMLTGVYALPDPAHIKFYRFDRNDLNWLDQVKPGSLKTIEFCTADSSTMSLNAYKAERDRTNYVFTMNKIMSEISPEIIIFSGTDPETGDSTLGHLDDVMKGVLPSIRWKTIPKNRIKLIFDTTKWTNGGGLRLLRSLVSFIPLSSIGDIEIKGKIPDEDLSLIQKAIADHVKRLDALGIGLDISSAEKASLAHKQAIPSVESRSEESSAAAPAAASGAGGGTHDSSSSSSSSSETAEAVVATSMDDLSRLSRSEKDQLILYLLRQQQVQQNMLSEFVKETRSRVRGLIEATAGIRDQQLRGFVYHPGIGIFPLRKDPLVDEKIKEQQALLDEIMGRFDEDEEEDSVDEEVQVRGGASASASSSSSSGNDLPPASPEKVILPPFLDVPGLYNFVDSGGVRRYRRSLINAAQAIYNNEMLTKGSENSKALLDMVNEGLGEEYWNGVETVWIGTGGSSIFGIIENPRSWEWPKDAPCLIYFSKMGEVLVVFKGMETIAEHTVLASWHTKAAGNYVNDAEETSYQRAFFGKRKGKFGKKGRGMYGGIMQAALSGFLDIARVIERRMSGLIRSMDRVKVIVEGHSLGGAIGHALAPSLSQRWLSDESTGRVDNSKNTQSYIGMGSPKVYRDEATVEEVLSKLGKTNMVNIMAFSHGIRDAVVETHGDFLPLTEYNVTSPVGDGAHGYTVPGLLTFHTDQRHSLNDSYAPAILGDGEMTL